MRRDGDTALCTNALKKLKAILVPVRRQRAMIANTQAANQAFEIAILYGVIEA